MDSVTVVLDISPNVVLVVDTQGIIQQANRTVSHVLGYGPTELEGTVVEELLMQAYDGERLDAIHRALDRIETLIEDLLTLAREGESSKTSRRSSL